MKKTYQADFMKKYKNLHETNNESDFKNALKETITCDGEMMKMFIFFNNIIEESKNIKKYGDSLPMKRIIKNMRNIQKTLDKMYFQLTWIKKCGSANTTFN